MVTLSESVKLASDKLTTYIGKGKGKGKGKLKEKLKEASPPAPRKEAGAETSDAAVDASVADTADASTCKL